jgi:hypothetical protein
MLGSLAALRTRFGVGGVRFGENGFPEPLLSTAAKQGRHIDLDAR